MENIDLDPDEWVEEPSATYKDSEEWPVGTKVRVTDERLLKVHCGKEYVIAGQFENGQLRLTDALKSLTPKTTLNTNPAKSQVWAFHQNNHHYLHQKRHKLRMVEIMFQWKRLLKNGNHHHHTIPKVRVMIQWKKLLKTLLQLIKLLLRNNLQLQT